MTTIFDDLYAETAVPALMAAMGRAVSYRDPETDAVALTALVGNVSVMEEDGVGGRRRRSMRQVIIGRDPLSEWGGVAAVKLGAEIDIDEEIWSVESAEATSANLVRLGCVRSESREKSRENYRRR